MTGSVHTDAGRLVAAQPPATVYAAVIVTWVVASVTAAMTVFLAAGLIVIGFPLLDVFGADLVLFLLGGTAAVVVFAAAADIVALLVLRGRAWARWVLVVMAGSAAAAGLTLAYHVAPLAWTVGGLAVITLLFTHDARAWFRDVHAQSDR